MVTEHLTEWRAQHHQPYKTKRSTLYSDVCGGNLPKSITFVRYLGNSKIFNRGGEICAYMYPYSTYWDRGNELW